MFGVLAQSMLGQTGSARRGREIAEWADSPEKLALVWLVGGAILIAVLVLVIKMKMDKD